MKEKISEKEIVKKICEQGYGIVKGMYDDRWEDEDEYVPEKWYVFRVWVESEYRKLIMYYNWKLGEAYFFIKEKMSDDDISNILKTGTYDVYDVEKYLKKEFPYLSTARKVAERIEKNGYITCLKDKKTLEYTSEYGDEFMSLVWGFLPYENVNCFYYYFDEENNRIIAGELEGFKKWFKKHNYPFRKPCYIEDGEECEEWEMEPDVDFCFL